MFEMWVIAEGNGRGEVILADAGGEADMPPQLRRRIRKLGPAIFPTQQAAAQFRREYEAAKHFTPVEVSRSAPG